MIKLVIFDLDDTLFLNERALWKTENRIAKSMGFKPLTMVQHRKTWIMPTKERLARNFPAADTDIFLEALLSCFPQLIKEKKLDAVSTNNAKVLDKLKKSGKRLAVLTSRPAAEVRHFLDGNHHHYKWAEKIYHAGNSQFFKPDPLVFGRILADFCVQPHEAVYIGDLALDAECAKGAGLHFIAVLENGLRTSKDFKPHSVDFFANTFPEILDYILSN